MVYSYGCYKVFLHNDDMVHVVFRDVLVFCDIRAYGMVLCDVLVLYDIQACDMAFHDVHHLYDIQVDNVLALCDILAYDTLALYDVLVHDDNLVYRCDMIPVFCDVHQNVVVVCNDHNDADWAYAPLDDVLAYAHHDVMDSKVLMMVSHIELELVLLTQMPKV